MFQCRAKYYKNYSRLFKFVQLYMSHFMRGCLIATLNYSIKGLQFIISTFKNAAIATFKHGYSLFIYFFSLSRPENLSSQNLQHTKPVTISINTATKPVTHTQTAISKKCYCQVTSSCENDRQPIINLVTILLYD